LEIKWLFGGTEESFGVQGEAPFIVLVGLRCETPVIVYKKEADPLTHIYSILFQQTYIKF